MKVRMLITAKSARKSPKTEMIWAYQRRRSMGMRRTAPIDNGSGNSGSIGGAAGAVVVADVLMDLFIVPVDSMFGVRPRLLK